MTPRKRERRLMEKAVDQLDHVLELTQKLAGEPLPPFLAETEKLKGRLRSRLSRYGYPDDKLDQVIFDIVEYHEACRKYILLVNEILAAGSEQASVLNSTLGSIMGRFDDWKRRLNALTRSLPRFRRLVSDSGGEQSRSNRHPRA